MDDLYNYETGLYSKTSFFVNINKPRITLIMPYEISVE